jgi:pimeloyl-ACP methyl ester carboxylesterase
MLTVETQPAEGPRYTASLVLVPGLWAGPSAWHGVASLLAHRGWECHLPDVRGRGALGDRAAAVAGYAAALPGQAVLVGHDAGALTALAAAPAARAAAVVLLAPLLPGSPGARALVRSPRHVAALVLGRPVPPPTGRAAVLLAGEAGVARLDGPEDAALLREVAWGRIEAAPAPGVPTLVLAGDRDPLLAPAAAAALARRIGAECATLAGATHWPLAGHGWRDAVDALHRWVVQRLGEPLLERYAETMAERAAGEAEEE